MEPDTRNGGCGVIYEAKLYVWGGQTLDIEPLEEGLEWGDEGGEPDPIEIITNLPRPDDKKHPFDVLDLNRMVWSRQPTSATHKEREKEEIPDLGLGSSLVLDPQEACFILFGGLNDLRFDAKVHRIYPGSWKWDIVEPSTDTMPTPRYLTGVIIHNNRLCVFGGVSVPIQAGIDPGAEYVAAHDDKGTMLDYGWNNEYFEMDLNTREWKAALHLDANGAPRAQGVVPERPDPIGGFAFAKVDSDRALMFGGLGSKGRVNEARIFNLEKREWSPPIPANNPWPSPTRFPSLTALVDPELVGQGLCGKCGPVLHQRLVLLWGKADGITVSRETWLLELEAGSTDFHWRKLRVAVKPRSWHVGLPHYFPGSTECQIIVFGGNAHIKGDSGARDDIADLHVLHFGVRSLFRQCLSLVALDPALKAHAAKKIGTILQTIIAETHEEYTNRPRSPPEVRIIDD